MIRTKIRNYPDWRRPIRCERGPRSCATALSLDPYGRKGGGRCQSNCLHVAKVKNFGSRGRTLCHKPEMLVWTLSSGFGRAQLSHFDFGRDVRKNTSGFLEMDI